MNFPHLEVDAKWQKRWESERSFQANLNPAQPKYYALDMFPYPSGSGLHVGHLASYTPTDVVARYKRARGFNVLHPMGYDAFGLPAEQYAMDTGVHPAITTQKAIETFRRQLKMFGFSFDWDREISTADPRFYKWTQFIFLKLFERGLAYQKEVAVNWCPELRTVLANEEVIDGKSERGGHPVVRVPMRQWMLKITDYAERLLKDLDKLDWPERTKDGQRNWIGKSEGAKVRFKIEGIQGDLEVFTTRPDTLFGVTFMVLAPEHPLVQSIVTSSQKSAVETYVQESAKKLEVERKANTTKSGVFTGSFALNPLLSASDPRARIPIWIADYVLMDYGTGAIMAVPGHDARDFEMAQTFGLPVRRVLSSDGELPFEGDGVLIDSEFLNGLDKAAAIDRVVNELEMRGFGDRQITYKLRDWLFSRQRYWGEPFPLVRTVQGIIPVGPDELPVELPEVADYQPTEKGEPPLARVSEFRSYLNERAGIRGDRETDTMPGSAGSSWYFLRYTDPQNDREAFSFDAQKYWMPVDLYVGGAEHTVGHLLYARFWQKVLFDAGLTSHDEPFQRLAHQGLVLGPDGQKMSKSRGNVVNPDDVQKSHGADAARLYICFMGPFDKDKPWSTNGIEGVRRFIDRIWRLVVDENGQTLPFKDEEPPLNLQKLLHKTIKKIGEDIETLSFNTSVSAMMILVNEIYKVGDTHREVMKGLAQLLMPFAPHLAEEIWSRLSEQGLVSLARWPDYDASLTVDDLVTMAVQVNGKTRGTIEVSPSAEESTALNEALKITSVVNALNGHSPAKVIYKAGKILNLIVKG